MSKIFEHKCQHCKLDLPGANDGEIQHLYNTNGKNFNITDMHQPRNNWRTGSFETDAICMMTYSKMSIDQLVRVEQALSELINAMRPLAGEDEPIILTIANADVDAIGELIRRKSAREAAA